MLSSQSKNICLKKTIDQFCFLIKRACAHLELKRTKNITHLLLKAHPRSRYQYNFSL